MGKLVGNCRENCPVVALLEARDGSYEQASMHDAMAAEGLSQVPHAKEVVMEGCPLGAPRHQRLSFAKLACSSEVASQQPPRPEYSEAAADSAALGMYVGDGTL